MNVNSLKQEQHDAHNTNMSSVPENQTDLEVILEFLEEHYRQESGMKSLWPTVVNTCEDKRPASETLSHVLEQEKTSFSDPVVQQIRADAETSDQVLVLRSNFTGPVSNALKEPERPLNPNRTPEETSKPLACITPAQKGKKLRLFHFLFEVLEDPKMAHCVSWVPASTGVFRFSPGHKEHVAELWGQRKGNRMPMTYQKMSRALRNYARSGEIIKVKKKLTYQFNTATLRTLKSQCDIKNGSFGVK